MITGRHENLIDDAVEMGGRKTFDRSHDLTGKNSGVCGADSRWSGTEKDAGKDARSGQTFKCIFLHDSRPEKN